MSDLTFSALRKMGISRAYASELASGKRRPSPAMAKRIEAEIGVPKERLRPDIWGASDTAT